MRLLAILILVTLSAGCTNMSNTFDKSPCACGDFTPLNVGNYEEDGNA